MFSDIYLYIAAHPYKTSAIVLGVVSCGFLAYIYLPSLFIVVPAMGDMTIEQKYLEHFPSGPAKAILNSAETYPLYLLSHTKTFVEKKFSRETIQLFFDFDGGALATMKDMVKHLAPSLDGSLVSAINFKLQQDITLLTRFSAANGYVLDMQRIARELHLARQTDVDAWVHGAATTWGISESVISEILAQMLIVYIN